MTTETIEIRPQEVQELALSSSADVVFYGGGAGGGKTWELLYEPIRHLDNPKFGAVIFRREMPQITNEGGLWDQSKELYPLLGGVPVKSPKMQYKFLSGAKITFSHLQHDKTVESYDGSQVPLFLWDELQHFTRYQFFYIMTRNRSLCGVKPYIRAGMNPTPPDHPVSGWIHEFVGWYLDEDGYIDPAKSGVIRWFVAKGDGLKWAMTKEELLEDDPKCMPKSFTFILSRLQDNQKLCEKNPEYRANLKLQPRYERERLLGDEERGGNWFVAPTSGKVFNKAWFHYVSAAPTVDCSEVVSFDLAATKKSITSQDPDYLAAGAMRKENRTGKVTICDIRRDRIAPSRVDEWRLNFLEERAAVCARDNVNLYVIQEQEPGASGKIVAHQTVELFQGFTVKVIASHKDKVVRAGPLSSQVDHGNVSILIGSWNADFVSEMHSFPDGSHDDQVDVATLAYNAFTDGFETYIKSADDWDAGSNLLGDF